MLSKLLKYDLKWIYKVVAVFYAMAFIFSIISRIFLSFDSVIFNIVYQICSGFAIAMMISILINNIMRLWARFVRNMYGDESYLTHTLPIESKTIYLSKFLSAIISMLTSTLVILICLFICFYSKENIEIIKNTLQSVAYIYDSTVIKLLLTIFIILFLEMLFILMIGYTGIIIGHKSNNNKMIKSIIIGFALYLLMQGLNILILFITSLFSDNIKSLFTNSLNINALKESMNIVIIVYLIYIIIYYFINQKELEKGIDVD